MSAEPSTPVAYLDSSALVKLVVREPESAALRRYLRDRPVRVSCALARVEVMRAVRAHGDAAVSRARAVLARTLLLALDDRLLDAAGLLDGGVLRSLDAVHLAAAMAFNGSLAVVVTYDRRMAAASVSLGCTVAAPS